ncbi:thermonuclease family protein [uncultured Neptuniibacter sp.]|uniref:thermonuclease family protein n=1 Tax=uncultured Neptuniibacter sp. TaxID=502143 RepID=UPI00262908F0|nr:thermonuclease family protein [uncultured Neptuniibacter sp.]
MPENAELVQIAHVYDGDTVLLDDGRRLRLIGMNTPELVRKGKQDEPYAREAAVFISRLLKSGDLRLTLGSEQQDRYKRWLGHLFVDGSLVSEKMVSEGLAYSISIPPNLRFSRCIKSAEAVARAKKRNLWEDRPWVDVRALAGDLSGFRLLRGRIRAVKEIEKGYLLDLDGRLAVFIDQTIAQGLCSIEGVDELSGLVGEEVYLRGWIRTKVSKKITDALSWSMKLTHVDHISIIRR